MSEINIRAKTTTLLEENIGINIYDLEFWFLNYNNKRKQRKHRSIWFHQNYIDLNIKGHYQESENTTYKMEENISKLCFVRF